MNINCLLVLQHNYSNIKVTICKLMRYMTMTMTMAMIQQVLL